MKFPYQVPVWKQAPFIRLLLPFIIGIILQWYLQFSFLLIIVSAIFSCTVLSIIHGLHLAARFKLQYIQGIAINLLLLSFGLFITWKKDNRNDPHWYGHSYNNEALLVITINEPPVEKAKSLKAEGVVEAVISKNKIESCNGKVLLYFLKDSVKHHFNYGDKILIKKELQPITNSGNPGAFNYKRYAAFQQIFHNVFLKPEDVIKLNERNIHPFRQFIFAAREKILSVLKRSIKGNDEAGIAEALLIGYKEDLDKNVVQAYSNTGVVHIIAISGLHLGLIYVILLWIFKHLGRLGRSKSIKVILVLSFLWLFSILTGASASVLRSAVMFSSLMIGENFVKKTSIYNSLAASAFILLCYDPYFLWDVGFQLSYLAVTGIVIFQKPFYNWIYIRNKWIDKVWQLMSVTLAAQVLTFPACIYYFHQFPLFFLLSNLIAVPLSSFILIAEIFLIALSQVASVSKYGGIVVEKSIWLMNEVVLWIDRLPYSVWDKISANLFSTFLLYLMVIYLSLWLMNRNRMYFAISLTFLLFITVYQAMSKWKIDGQQKLVIYNTPKYTAVDFASGSNYFFSGDSILQKEGLLQNFHLKPGRIAMQLTEQTNCLQGLFQCGSFYQFGNKKIFLVNEQPHFQPTKNKLNVDVVIVSKTKTLRISELSEIFNCSQFVFDASNSLWKIEKWKKECEGLHLRYHSIPQQGAYILDCNQ